MMGKGKENRNDNKVKEENLSREERQLEKVLHILRIHPKGLIRIHEMSMKKKKAKWETQKDLATSNRGIRKKRKTVEEIRSLAKDRRVELLDI